MGVVVFICALLLAYWALRRLSRIGQREPYLPPGPRTTPILGNLLAFPTSKAHLRYCQECHVQGGVLPKFHSRFTEWAQEYGDIFSVRRAYILYHVAQHANLSIQLKLVSNNVVVVSSAKLVRELDVKGATTSDRPAIHAAEIVYGDYELVFARHGTFHWYHLVHGFSQI